jgi:hypothetical protein
MGEKEIFAFSEKIRNASGSAGNNANTMLRGCTRLDPLTYILFGATEVRVLGDGVECDYWLPITGNLDSLDNLEKLRSIMDVIMLRVFEGIGKRRPPQGQVPAHADDENEGDEDEEDWSDRTDLSLSAQETAEFELMTQGIVRVLDGYAAERGWVSGSRGSTRPGSPAAGIGSLSLGGSRTGLSGWGDSVALASSNASASNGGSRWTSRSQTPDVAPSSASTIPTSVVNTTSTTNTAPSQAGAKESWRGRAASARGRAAGHSRNGRSAAGSAAGQS